MEWFLNAMSSWYSSIFAVYSPTLLLGFFAVVVLCLVIDLKAHGGDKPITSLNAGIWSVIWISVSLAFAYYISTAYGAEKSSLFLTGYFLEKSLSVDNLFVIMAIFASFSIKPEYQHRALYYGILGALVLRMFFVSFGTVLASMSHWVLLAFGLFVLWTAWKMATVNEAADEIEDYSDHFAVRWTKKLFPVHNKLDGHNFFTREGGVLAATPLFLALVCVEFSDVAFAFDSVPAVIAVTKDPMLVYTSNIFAILGLRSLYFLLVDAKRYLVHLEKAVVVILAFIGIKMIAGTFDVMHIEPNVSLWIVLGTLGLGIIASIVFPKKEEEAQVAVVVK